MARSMDSQDDDVGIRPSRAPSRAGTTIPVPASTAASVASAARASAARCVALFELFRGGSGAVQLGRLHDGQDAPRLVALRRLANIPTRELESATTRAQGVTHPRLARVLGTYQHEDAWYIASEYIPGVTLFELGQTAVRQRTPVAAPVAVRIVLDALQVTGEAEELFAEITGSPRCLYPESIWIADSGELFLSELLVAPVLARTTTGASYVAVTAGMSAPASDVRAAAVELARLACARLMNGNPASWQTRELPDELSELLARAVRGGPGAETPAAFAARVVSARSTADCLARNRARGSRTADGAGALASPRAAANDPGPNRGNRTPRVSFAWRPLRRRFQTLARRSAARSRHLWARRAWPPRAHLRYLPRSRMRTSPMRRLRESATRPRRSPELRRRPRRP